LYFFAAAAVTEFGLTLFTRKKKIV